MFRNMKTLTAIAALTLGAGVSTAQEEGERLLSIGGSVTEIVYALGQQDRLIARDTTSTWPAGVEELPNVGYMRALAPEGVLSVEPDLIIAEEGSGPPETIELLEEANIEFITIPDGFDREAVSVKIQAVADALGVPERGAQLAAELDAELAAAAENAMTEDPKRVMFILSLNGGRITAAGTNTAAEGIIHLAGGVNVITEFEGYKQLSDEAISAAAPDVILMMDRGDHGAADEELFTMPALITTPAAQTRSVVRMNGGLLLGFGPRIGQAITELNQALYQ